LAGFLAPRLNEIAAAPGAGAAPADTSIGDLLSNVGSIFDAVGRSARNTGSGPTQKDRDNKTLQPFAADIAHLEALRPSIGESQFQSRVRAKFQEFGVNNPVLIGAARESVLGITGVEVGVEEFNAFDAQQDAVAAFAQTPRGQLALFSILPNAKNPETGELDSDIAFAMLAQSAAAAAQDDAQLDAINLQLQKMQGLSAQRELFLKDVVDERNNFYLGRAQETASGFALSAIESGAKLTDATAFLTGLRQNRAALAQEIVRDAARGGFQNHPDFSVDNALAPYDILIDMVDGMGKDAVQAFANVQALEATEAARIVSGILGVPLGTNRDVMAYFGQVMVDDNVKKLREGVVGLDKTKMKEAARGESLFPQTAVATTPDTPPVVGSDATDEATATARGLNDEERVNEVKVGMATFGTYLPNGHGGNENFRAVAVESFGRAAAAMNTSEQPVAGATFDKVYDNKFFTTYNDITRHGDGTAANLQSAVTKNLATVFEQRYGLAMIRLANDFSAEFPEIGLKFNGKEIEVDFSGTKAGKNKFLAETLQRKNLPFTLEGLRRLAILEPNNPAFLAFSETRGITSIIKEVKFLNKIIGTVNRLPDLAPHIIPAIEERVNNTGAAKLIINSREEYDPLDNGTVYWLRDSEGNLHRKVKGEE
jgi:hypothetical protein